MEEILQALPGARRAFFRLYHIGGCQSCAFSPTETLADLCARNDLADPADVLAQVESEAAAEARLLVPALDLARELVSPTPPTLLDIRTAEEFQAVHVHGSRHLDQPAVQEILASPNRTAPFVLIDHLGDRALDAAAYFIGHGLENVRALRGGIDAWSQEVNPELPRYTLE
jgi:rhodanese-related sulfurtransferase